MPLDIFHNKYSVESFDHACFGINEETKAIEIFNEQEVIPGREVNQLTPNEADKCLRVWQSIMHDTTIDHSLRTNLAGNISSLRAWAQKKQDPNGEEPFENQIKSVEKQIKTGNRELAINTVNIMILDGCNRENLEKIKDTGYQFYLSDQTNISFFCQLDAAFSVKNYEAANFLLDQMPNINFHLEEGCKEPSFYKTIMEDSLDIYFLEELKNRGHLKGEDEDLASSLSNNLRNNRLSENELLDLYKFLIDNNLSKKESFGKTFAFYFKTSKEKLISFFVNQGVSLPEEHKKDFIKSLYNPNYKAANKFYDLMDKHLDLKINDRVDIFHYAILSGNSVLFKKVYAKLDRNDLDRFLEEEWREIFSYVQFSQNDQILDLALSHLLNEKNKNIILQIGVQMQDPIFVDSLLNKVNYSNKELKENYDLSIKLGNVLIMRQIAQKLTPVKIDEQIIEDIRGQLTSNFESKENMLYFNQLLLQSGYPYGLQFLDMIKQVYPAHEQFLQNIQDDYWNWIPYVGHFNPFLEDELNKAYPRQDTTSYIERQINYGHQMHTSTINCAKNNPPTLKKTILENYAQDRYDVAQQTKYKTERKIPYTTPMVHSSIKGKKGTINTRYSPFQNICMSMWKTFGDPIDREEQLSYTIKYKHPEEIRPFPLTSCTYSLNEPGWHWDHTETFHLQKLWPHMETLHKELVDLKVDPHNPKGVKRFEKKLSQAYWLGCHLMLTERGNSQYFLNWLVNMCVQKGFKAPIASNKYPLVDCIALSVPLEVFQKNFRSYFDCILEPAETSSEEK